MSLLALLPSVLLAQLVLLAPLEAVFLAKVIVKFALQNLHAQSVKMDTSSMVQHALLAQTTAKLASPTKLAAVVPKVLFQQPKIQIQNLSVLHVLPIAKHV